MSIFGVRVCSLKVDVPQLIEPGAYQVVRFPFGGAESCDEHDMHQAAQPDGYEVADWACDDRSGLIWPCASGWGHLYAMVQWEAGDYRELRDQYVRDPLGLTGPPDTTATAPEETSWSCQPVSFSGVQQSSQTSTRWSRWSEA